MLLFIVFNYYPFFKAVFLSFTLTDKTGHFAKWVGLSNWIRILGKSSFWQVIWITVKMAAINLVFTYLIALLFALLAMKKTRFSKIYQTMYALPMAIASSPAAAIFLFIYRQKNGLLNELLGDHADALRAVGGMCHDDLDACGSQFHLPAGGISQCIGGGAGECQTGWRGSVTESSIYSASYVIFATVFCTVFKYIRFVQVLCTDQAFDKRRTCQRNEESDLLYL